MTEFIDGGVCAPEGFTANGICCGIKKGRETNDIAVILSEKSCEAAALFTRNTVKAEPVKLTKKHIADGIARAVIANAGNANACTGAQGYENAERTAAAAARQLNLDPEDVLVCSTGVIGQQINIEAIERGMPGLCASVSKEGHRAAREAIMTTDTRHKEAAVKTEIGGKTVIIGTMAKGSGMIHINMGTMLAFITTDCAISASMLDSALRESAEKTYNCISIDGDTSTNDTLIIMANGLAGNNPISEKNEDYHRFMAALNELNTVMAKRIAADGEGAEHLIECSVLGASDDSAARNLAKTVISSSLVKAAFFGRDANWGRILCAMGYSGESFTQEKTSVFFSSAAGEIEVFHEGIPVCFNENMAKDILSEDAVTIIIRLEDGSGSGTAWGCDLTYKYVEINGDYRT
ncbi:bifunctional glutamate N-acetyltransferase/amino-acid acetyltransferase ArgJ [Brucepastera parasyntrophica]|uniref:bifunctional glutamate N-acetyltransferase/amino-acid acetyltransferase ArgJ n=1 Tax=Brucepastera parasyntrophica TaxID=2880008 RepID=UPI002108A636|nr:bifunctional glutamate N-acetyltransferase/amino-acid acetyltransferase ArgJ [Brucepastera parasyntrophica]ULQ59574.1 bifunctional glutamate N-acetyltransferase/amino-acid acetyltransferase ArgJ [Brucepastera parasyntrophica]